MRIVIENGKFKTKTYPEDKRRILYLVDKGENKEWVNRKDVLSLISSYQISNAEIKGSNIVQVEEVLKMEKITSKNIDKLKAFLRNYLEESKNWDYYDYDDNIYFFGKALEKLEEDGLNYCKNMCIFFYGNSLEGWFYIGKEFGVPFITMNYSRSYEDKIIYKMVKMLSQKLKGCIFYSEYFLKCFENTEFKVLNFKSNFIDNDEDKEYSFYHGCYLTEYDTNIAIKYIENKIYPKIDDFSKIKIKKVKGKDLSHYLDFLKSKVKSDYFNYTWRKTSFYPVIVGFHYFSLDDIYETHNQDKDYLLAIYDGYILGVIKYGIWSNNKHQSIAYIDTHLLYRNQGIATMMISKIDKYLYPNMPLILTDESEMGKETGMSEKFKKYVKSVKVKTYEECLRDGSYY